MIRSLPLPRRFVLRPLAPASLSLAVWERKLPVVAVLGVLCLAHWALLFRGMFIITATYSPTTLSCAVTTTKLLFLSITYWASACRFSGVVVDAATARLGRLSSDT